MIRVTIQVQREGDAAWHDLDVPAEVPARQLAAQIATAMGWAAEGAPSDLAVFPSGRLLAATESLAEAGIWDGSMLIVKPGARVVERPTGEAYLEGASGKAYRLTAPETSLGRGQGAPDVPSIDLRSEPAGETVSHDHARMILVGEDWTITLSPTARNRSTLNGEPLAPGQSRVLTPGARLQLGGVALTFFRHKATDAARTGGALDTLWGQRGPGV